jgi:hypothetical protein
MIFDTLVKREGGYGGRGKRRRKRERTREGGGKRGIKGGKDIFEREGEKER